MRGAKCRNAISRKKNRMAKVIVITGASRGLGACLRKELVSRGHTVVATSRFPAPGCVRCDSSNPLATRVLAETVARTCGSLDIWINNAALSLSDESKDFDAMAEVVATNMGGSIVGTQVALHCGAGLVVNVFGSGHDGRAEYCAGHSIYASTKAGVSMFTRSLRPPPNQRVVGVSPGLLDTCMLADQIAGQNVGPLANRLLSLLAVDPDIAAESIADFVLDPDPPEFYDALPRNLMAKARAAVFPRKSST